MTASIPPRITVLTLGVDDLERSVAFYRDGLGWPTDGIIGEPAEGRVCFFQVSPSLTLALWGRESLARDAGLPVGPPSATELSLGYNVNGRDEADAVYTTAIAAGATPVKAPSPTFWGGYGGYFQDPDGHLWEVVHNPELLPG